MKSKTQIKVSPVADISEFSQTGTLVAFNAAWNGLLYFVFALCPLNYREENKGGASFAKTQTAQGQSYRVLALDKSRVVLDVTIENEPFNIHFVAPLPQGILLACGRAEFRSADDYEKNGRIYSRTGKFERAILLGDGIQNLQTTARGAIWTSFFDEGVFGNFGWDNPVGASGLVQWNSAGEILYRFEPGDELDSICDCYALNVPNDNEVWCYYYTEFPLVKIASGAITAHWQMPVAGADAFAIEKQYALFRGGYDERDTYRLYRLADKEVVEERQVELLDENGRHHFAQHAIGKGEAIYLVKEKSVYRFDVGMALS